MSNTTARTTGTNPDLGINPTYAEFSELAKHRRAIAVWAKIMADGATAPAIYHRLAEPDCGGFLLESAEIDGTWSRYSFIGVRSSLRLENRGDHAHWVGSVPAGIPTTGPVLDVLGAAIDELSAAPQQGAPPLAGGFVGHIGYDAVRLWEKVTDQGRDELLIPEVSLQLVTDLVVMDHKDGTAWITSVAINHDGTSAGERAAYERATRRVQQMYGTLRDDPPALTPCLVPPTKPAPHCDSAYDYAAAVSAVKDAIVAGEVFQTVVSQRFSRSYAGTPMNLYRQLRRSNPSPYMYLIHGQDTEGELYHVVGASPEALVRVTQGTVITHPIAGTRPRGASDAVDVERARDLLEDAKERSEHVMLVDLARNDVAKVCEPNSVQVTEFMAVQKFSHVIHLVSEVTGALREPLNAVDVLRATFPAGTLTGAPKPRAMNLIDELEPLRRGIYGGVVGYFALTGDADLAIAIRTAVIKGQIAHVQAGAGIVADSSAASEHAECVAKAGAVLAALHYATDTDTLEA